VLENHQQSQKIIILDRDGVINHDSDEFIKSPAEWKPIEGSLEAIAQLSSAGFSVFIITNQSGIARGLFSQEVLDAIHHKMISQTESVGGKIKGIYFCPHGPDEQCDCRKPKSGMYAQLAEEHNVSFENSYSIGDSLRDLEAATDAGAEPVLVLTGKGMKTQKLLSTPQHPLHNTNTFANLSAFVQELLN